MLKSIKTSRVLLCLSIVCLLSIKTKSTPNLLSVNCPNTTSYTPNSTYKTNLNTLFSSLSSNSRSINGFSNSTAGRNPPDIAYGLFLCRGDVSTAVCQDCVTSAIAKIAKKSKSQPTSQTEAKEVVQRCPKSKDVIIWYDECMLRYSNESIFSKSDESTGLILRNTQNFTDQTRFREILGGVMDDIATRASNGGSG
ncbi:hypothetical protein ACSBR2_015975 [Camellia fascicularis]